MLLETPLPNCFGVDIHFIRTWLNRWADLSFHFHLNWELIWVDIEFINKYKVFITTLFLLFSKTFCLKLFSHKSRSTRSGEATQRASKDIFYKMCVNKIGPRTRKSRYSVINAHFIVSDIDNNVEALNDMLK